MEKGEFCYEDWLAGEKASLLSFIETTFQRRGIIVSGSDLKDIDIAFNIAAQCHDTTDKRDSGELYLTHPIAVVIILLLEFPDTNITQIFIALLHDTIEKNRIFATIISERLSQDLTNHILAISKKELTEYVEGRPETDQLLFQSKRILTEDVPRFAPHITLDEIELAIIKKGHTFLLKGLKHERNHEYFLGLETLDDDEWRAKVADRLHNLRTIDSCTPDKQQSTIASTKCYFLPVAERRDPVAYRLLVTELEKIENRKAERAMNSARENNKKKVNDAFGPRTL